MKALAIALTLSVALATPAAAATITPALTIPTQDTATLYRNSPVVDGANMRIHVATFDVDSTYKGSVWEYNSTNCQLAADLFQKQLGVTVRYWCERGRYKE